MAIKIFEAESLRKALQDCFAEGYRPATIEETWKIRDEGKIPDNWYDTGTLWYKGVFRQLTITDFEEIDLVYEEGGRLVWLGSVGYYDSFAYGVGLDGDDGRLVGVKDEEHHPQEGGAISHLSTLH